MQSSEFILLKKFESPKLSNLVLIFISVESFYVESSISICKRFQTSMYKVLYLVV